jgi:hypothetical protein
MKKIKKQKLLKNKMKMVIERKYENNNLNSNKIYLDMKILYEKKGFIYKDMQIKR